MEVISTKLRNWELLGLMIFAIAVMLSHYIGKEWWVTAIFLTGFTIYIVCLSLRVRGWMMKRKDKNWMGENNGGN